MTTLVPVLTPHGRLLLERTSDAPALPPDLSHWLQASFARGSGQGLLQLGAAEVGTPLPPVFGYWREFAARYVSGVCGQHDLDETRTHTSLPPPSHGELEMLTAVVPPMVGASGSDIYETRIEVTAIPKARWRGICRDCTGGIDSLIELLQGRLSTSVMARICEPKTGLFPAPKEISFQCSCPDWAWMCKHVAAVLYGVGARLDQRPELLFLLRGVDQQDLIARADTGLRPAGQALQKRKVLDAGDLSEIFGIEIAQANPQSVQAVTRKPVGSREARATPRRRGGEDPATAGAKPETFAPETRTKQAAKTASRTPVLSARRRAAISARMRAYWRERRTRERQKPR